MAKPKQILSNYEKKLITFLYGIGKTDKQVSEAMGIPKTTMIDMIKYNGLTDTVKNAKEEADQLVERALFQRATGYEYKEEKAFCYEGDIFKETVQKVCPPDPLSIFYWLGNRQPKKWKNVQRVEHTDPEGHFKRFLIQDAKRKEANKSIKNRKRK